MDPVLGPILKQIFSKEMETDNLKFADYDQTSDHSTFLVFFLRQAFAVPKEGFYPLEFDEKKVSIPLNKDIINIGKGYYQSVLDMGPTQIMGSVMYMEEKLVPMYCNMLQMDVFKMNNPPKYVVAFKKFIHVHVETYRRSMGSDPDLISAMDPITYSFEEQYEFLFGMFQKAFPELISEYV
ncbi:MAG: hypothetical protein NTZ44_04130 [Candidatus Nomurabacteria bacterium]|nr:hypothetical protein [Candidatus Nomurabacteria bacterium]